MKTRSSREKNPHPPKKKQSKICLVKLNQFEHRNGITTGVNPAVSR